MNSGNHLECSQSRSARVGIPSAFLPLHTTLIFQWTLWIFCCGGRKNIQHAQTPVDDEGKQEGIQTFLYLPVTWFAYFVSELMFFTLAFCQHFWTLLGTSRRWRRSGWEWRFLPKKEGVSWARSLPGISWSDFCRGWVTTIDDRTQLCKDDSFVIPKATRFHTVRSDRRRMPWGNWKSSWPTWRTCDITDQEFGTISRDEKPCLN